MECNLPPLKAIIEAKNTNIASKNLTAERPSIFQAQLKRELGRHPDLPIPSSYMALLGHQIRNTGLAKTLAELKPDKSHPGYQAPAPWVTQRPIFNISTLPTSKKLCSPTNLQQTAQRSIQEVESANTISYYTDGSVNTDLPATGAAVYSKNYTASWRLSNTCSTMQTELFAIKEALQHSLLHEDKSVVVHTDSLSSLTSLKNNDLSNNKGLKTNILHIIQQLQLQNRSVTFNWIPSHIGIPGNEKADQLAKNALHSTHINIKIQPSHTQLKKHTKTYTHNHKLNNFKYWLNQSSPSAQWYYKATGLKEPPFGKECTRGLAVAYHRLRLGYKCNWEIEQPTNRDCKHCNTETSLPLLHYLLECPKTVTLRAGQATHCIASSPNAFEEATKLTHHICNTDTTANTLRQYPPPR